MVNSESLPGFKTMISLFCFLFTVLATINLQSQHELELLTNYLLSVQVSLAQGQLPVLLGVSVGSSRVKWNLCQKVGGVLGYLQLCPGLWIRKRRTQDLLSLSSHSHPFALWLPTPVVSMLLFPQSEEQHRSGEISLELLLYRLMHGCGFLPLEKGALFGILGSVCS